ncbi:MAG: NAD(P)H-dependent oxidoreductase subunit E [Bacteroidetes bacterium]|nr:NAD(P)H-dependent oxidoreductase subunit E [Bacteroidota bacterium]
MSVPKYTHHIFVCENYRDPSDPRGCCAAKGSEAIRKKLKEELKKRGLKGQARANKAGCLDQCAKGPAVVVYPEGIWYAHVTENDVEEIVESHIVGGKPVERLLMK